MILIISANAKLRSDRHRWRRALDIAADSGAVAKIHALLPSLGALPGWSEVASDWTVNLGVQTAGST
jgi:hypothetical protein